MMTSTTARSSPHKKRPGGPTRARGRGKKPFYHRQHNDDNVLPPRSSPPLPSRCTLLERIGGSVDEDNVSMEEADLNFITTDFPFTTDYHSPEPGEVERFLESVIGAPPPPPPPRHAFSGNQATLAPETLNLPAHDPSNSPSPFIVSSTVDQNLFSGDTMPLLSPSTIDECRKHLAPVLVAFTQARDPANRLDVEQCLGLLSDDRCSNLFRRAKEMRHQLSSLVSQKAPANHGWSGSVKRDRMDAVDTWVRSTRSRFDSVNTAASDASTRRDSDITLVDVTAARLPPKAPRAMLLASQGPSNRSLSNAQTRAPYEAPVASLTTEVTPSVAKTLFELVLKMFPALTPNSQPEPMSDRENAPVGTLTVDQSESRPNQAVSSPHAQQPGSATDFVSHLPTEPGIWFRQQGRQYAEIVDVEIDVSDEMFYVSGERLPIRLRMHLRLCSVPVGVATENNRGGDAPASLQDVDRVIERRELHWPKEGKLVVQVNPETERSATWLPFNLDSDPLDVTGCVRPGKNTFRFIQLSDLSGFTFVLAASLPPPEEAWRSFDWASIVDASRARSEAVAQTDDGGMDGLADVSEFARIPINIVRP